MEPLSESELENKLACRHGWLPVLDRRRGFGWCLFKKEGEAVWKVQDGWMRGKLVDDVYTEHQRYASLEEALTDKKECWNCGEEFVESADPGQFNFCCHACETEWVNKPLEEEM